MPNIVPSLWIDADACPVPAREVLVKAARRTGVTTRFVANHALPIKPSGSITVITVSEGFDRADNYIAENLAACDFLVTSDIPLASIAIEKGCTVVNGRGEAFTTENIRQRLSMRNFMESMRDTLSAQHPSVNARQKNTQAAYDAKDKQRFANALNTWLTKQKVI